MKPSLFITGITGFLGKALLKNINSDNFDSIYCLIRDKNSDILDSYSSNFVKVAGDLDNTETYKDVLEKTDTVLHMAAVTGKVSPKIYEKNIVEGTEKLIEACKEHQIKNLIYVSSIAAKFKIKKRYYYGLAKSEAEKSIKKSGLNYTIIRPTMIMGKNSPVFEGFSKLALLPIIPVFGKGKTKIQPVSDTDVAKITLSILEQNYFKNQIMEIGGPEIISINDFLKKINNKKKNNKNKNPKLLHLPMGLTVFGLTILETIAYKFLPITVGQLASFRNNSTAEKNQFTENFMNMKGMDDMITEGLIPPSSTNHKKLIKECKTFTKYLSGTKANRYIVDNYIKYHNISKVEEIKKPVFFEKILLKISTIHPFFTKFIDIYTKFLKPQTVLRFKLSYLLAILEVSSPYYKKIDLTNGIGKFSFLILLGLRGGIFALQLFLTLILILPFDILFRIIQKSGGETKNV